MGIQRVFHQGFKEVHETIKEGGISGCFQSVSIFSSIFPACFNVSSMFQRCFKYVPRNFRAFQQKFFIAWYSSQLPEQKEGLFKMVQGVLAVLSSNS